jgi:hypothetical protein
MGWWFGGLGGWGVSGFGAFLLNILGLLSFVLWIVLMVKAFQGVRFKLPVAGDVAEALAGRPVGVITSQPCLSLQGCIFLTFGQNKQNVE